MSGGQRRFDLGRLSPDSIAAMWIAFYAPMKSPDHPVVSGDRQVARLLLRALAAAGHTASVASALRAYLPEPDFDRLENLKREADVEVERLTLEWIGQEKPDLWFTYHPYYKSPDLLGPPLAARFGIPYITAEASWSRRRDHEAWAVSQRHVADAVRGAAVNLCFTWRDREGLSRIVDEAKLALLPPFIDVSPFAPAAAGASHRLVTVAMMRAGDKLESYGILAKALGQLSDVPWTLAIVGDGPRRDEVRRLFSDLPPDRIDWLGELPQQEVAAILAASAVYVWPGRGEAFGLAYLEAQAAGLPVVAMETAGVPEVMTHGETGWLTPDGDVDAYAAAIRRLLGNGDERGRLGRNGRRRMRERHSLDAAAERLRNLLPERMPAR